MYLMEFLWGLNHTNFPNMCPYFWLSVVNVLISPICVPLWFFVKSIRIINRSLKEKRQRRLEEEREERIQRYKALLLQGVKFKELLISAKWELDDDLSKKERKVSRFFRDEILDDLNSEERQHYYTLLNKLRVEREVKKAEKYLQEAPQREKQRIYQQKLQQHKDKEKAKKRIRLKEKEEKRHKKYERKNKRRQKWKQFWAPVKLSHSRKQQLIGMWTIRIKMFFKAVKFILLICLAMASILGIWKLTTLDYSWVIEIPWLSVWWFTWRILLGMLVPILLFKLVKHIGEYLEYHPIKLPWLKKILYILYIFYPIVLLWKGIFLVGVGIGKLWSLLMTLKSDNCPGIDWE